MYSAILMVAVSGGVDAPALGGELKSKISNMGGGCQGLGLKDRLSGLKGKINLPKLGEHSTKAAAAPKGQAAGKAQAAAAPKAQAAGKAQAAAPKAQAAKAPAAKAQAPKAQAPKAQAAKVKG